MDQRKIKCLNEQAKEHNHDFEQRHVDVLNFIKTEDQAALDSEEAVFNEHVNCISDIIKRLEQLEDLIASTEPAIPHASDKGNGHHEEEYLSRRLSQVHDFLMKVKRVVEGKELDTCVLEGHKERLGSIDTDLHGIKHDMLL